MLVNSAAVFREDSAQALDPAIFAEAMAVILLEGLIITILALTGLRERVLHALLVACTTRGLHVDPPPHGAASAPGQGPAPKPVTLPAGKLRDALGVREVSYTKGQQALALKDQKLT